MRARAPRYSRISGIDEGQHRNEQKYEEKAAEHGMRMRPYAPSGGGWRAEKCDPLQSISLKQNVERNTAIRL
jgi:hypothetical protein